MTYLPDNTDYRFKAWNYGLNDAHCFDACTPGVWENSEELKREYLEGYAKGMEANLKILGGIAPERYRDALALELGV